MFVKEILSPARIRLVTIADDVPLIEVAKLLRSGTDIVVVCDSAGLMTGVITKTDVVAQISHCQGSNCTNPASSVMTQDIVLCRSDDELHTVWSRMKERGLKNIPIIDQDSRPVGMLTARDALQALLRETENDESLLRDYVMGIGYR
jgi:predicted transcriptional regulator